MAITYRIGHDGRLSVQEMDNNFQYIEDELGTLGSDVSGLTADVAGLTASVIDLQNTFSNIDGSFHFLLLVSGVTQSGTFSFTNGILATYSLV